MNKIKLFTLPITILISFVLLLLIIHLILKPFKAKKDEDGNLKLAYGIWFFALFMSGASIVANVVRLSLEVVDNVTKIRPDQLILLIIQSIASITILAFLWFLIWFYVTKFLTKIVVFTGSDGQEMSANNYTYFIIKGSILIGIVLSLSSVLELLLRLVVPNIEVPFYH
ncbi:hypothetical protein [Pedobacter foliorum]|uniref:hypothetical protein n=1 Tax=Pedobacter foliorum TaxID=2739058 RepID=UPI001566F8BF|nr:hypothetical protein [Pedobacter foliorum]NRF37758.1 hypothetical protein [Pedobacter foliorum]